MDSDLFDNVNPVHLSAESSSNDDFLQGAQGSPFRPFMENFYPGDGMNQDDTMSGAMPPSTATATQQPTMSGALPDASQAPAQDKDVARDPSPSIAMPSAPASEPVRETIATTEDAPSIDAAHAPPSPVGHATANGTTTVEDDSLFGETAPTAATGGREASVHLGDDQSRVRIQESTEITETEINGQSVVVESHTEVIEETHKEGTTASAPPEPMTIEKHVETVIETPIPADIEPETREAVTMDMVEDVAGSPPADTIELEIPEPPSPDSGSDASIPAGTPQQQHQEPILGSMSVPPKRGAADASTDSGTRRRRRTAADMLADASSMFVSSDYSDRNKRSAPVQPSSSVAATPVKTPGRKKAKAAAVPRVAALKTPKAKPTARKSMAVGKTASPAAKVRTPRSAPGKVAAKLPKSAGKTPVSAKRPVPAATDETPKRRGRPPKAPDSATAARTPVKTPAKSPAKAPATEPARRGRPISAGKRTSPLKKRHSLSARLSAPKVTKVDAKSTPTAKAAATPKSGAKAKAAPAEPPIRRGRPPKTATDSGDDAKQASSAKSEETASKPARGRKAKVETEAVKPTRGKASAPAPKPTRGRVAKPAEPPKPAAAAAKRPGRTAKADAKASIATTTTTAAKKPTAAPKATATVADAPKRRGRPPKAATAKDEVVEPEPKKQKTTRQTKASSASKLAPEPKPEPVKKNKGGRPPKKTTSTATKREPATEREPATQKAKAQAQDTVKPGRGRPKQAQPVAPVSAPEPAKPTRGRGRAGKGDVAPVKEKPAAKAAEKNSVASGRVTKSKAAPTGAAATRSLRSRA